MNDRLRLAPIIKSTNQRRVLIDLINKHDWRNGAEIGVLKGKTLFSILIACPKITMLGVDRWKTVKLRNEDFAETYSQYNMEQLANKVMQQAKDFGDRCIITRGESDEIASTLEDNSLDFVFIDADHTESGVTRDIKNWSPKVKQGGMILGHDNHWPSVKKVIDLYFPDWVDYGEAVWGTVKK